MASGSKIVETGIYAVGALIVIYYAVTHQDQLKMWYNNFVMSAQSQLSGGDNMGGSTAAPQQATTGDNTSGSDNTPAATTPTATPTPDNTSTGEQTLDTPSVPDNNITNPLTSPQNNPQPSTNTGLPPIVSQPQPTPTRRQITPNATPIAPQQKVIGDSQSLQQGIDRMRLQQQLAVARQQAIMQSMMRMPRQGTIPNVNDFRVNPFVQPPPGNIGQNPLTTTGRNMKQMQKVVAPRQSNNLSDQKRRAVAAGNVITTPDQANQMCVCSTEGRWRGPGCNVGGKFCGMTGQRGTKR